jgi:hypothetical protein
MSDSGNHRSMDGFVIVLIFSLTRDVPFVPRMSLSLISGII